MLRAQHSNHLGGIGSAHLSVSKEKGSLLYSNRKEFIDFTSGWCVGNLGWSFNEVKDAIKSFDGPYYVTPHDFYWPREILAKKLTELAPGNLQKCFRATGGTEAVEIALQAAMIHTKREKFVSIEGSYHGNSIAAKMVGDDDLEHDRNFLQVSKIPLPLDESALAKAETILKHKDRAALIMEPVICNLNVHIPTQEFFDGIQKLCKKYGTLFIVDEVATGFGRTGKLFASERFNLKPDIMCLAKAITGGYAPMGATLMTNAVAKSVEDEADFYSTYGWHPLSVEAAVTNLNYWKVNGRKIFEHVQHLSDLFFEQLQVMKTKDISKINICGLAIGIEAENENFGSKVKKRAEKKGLIVSDSENGISLFPPLNTPLRVAKKGLDILESCL
jgi:adenosylmethionine-8-amino-7-oxononanoate aminotransferase